MSLATTRKSAKRKGLCIICNQRVCATEPYIEVKEGYCHKNCVFSNRGGVKA